MVDEAILGALKSALERGESLKRAMMTLYNAGYRKEDISDAARSINQPELQSQQIQVPQTQNLSQPKTISLQYPAQPQPVQMQQPQQQIASQKVSGYGQPPKQSGKIVIILLGFLLLVLVGILATIFLFKE